MRKKKVSNHQSTMFSSQTKKQKADLEHVTQEWHIAVGSVSLARQLSEDVGIWGMHLERYPNRLTSISWWLHTDLELSEEYSDAPRVDDYGFGTYMSHNPKVDEFVKARAKWILPQLEDELKGALFKKESLEVAAKPW